MNIRDIPTAPPPKHTTVQMAVIQDVDGLDLTIYALRSDGAIFYCSPFGKDTEWTQVPSVPGTLPGT